MITFHAAVGRVEPSGTITGFIGDFPGETNGKTLMRALHHRIYSPRLVAILMELGAWMFLGDLNRPATRIFLTESQFLSAADDEGVFLIVLYNERRWYARSADNKQWIPLSVLLAEDAR